MAEIDSVAMLELDRNGDCLYTYVYPKLAEETRAYVDSKLKWTSNTPVFVWGRTAVGFVYILHSPPLEHSVVNKCACVITSGECHPIKYRDLAQVFLNTFVDGEFDGTQLVNTFTLVSIKSRVKKLWNAQDYAPFDPTTDIDLAGFLSQFQVDIILVVTALLLRKRVAIFSPDAAQLETACLCVAALASPSRRWKVLFPLLKGSDARVLEDRAEFIAGFNDAMPSDDTYDVVVDVPNGDVQVSPDSQDSFVMGRFHKDLATDLLTAAQEGQATADITQMLHERLGQLDDVLDTVRDDHGKVSIDKLKEQKMSNAMRTFCINYARAQGAL